jgi:hypothetical protein
MEVTLEAEESVGGSRKERNALSRQFSLAQNAFSGL